MKGEEDNDAYGIMMSDESGGMTRDRGGSPGSKPRVLLAPVPRPRHSTMAKGPSINGFGSSAASTIQYHTSSRLFLTLSFRLVQCV